MKNGSTITRNYNVAENLDAIKIFRQLLCRPDLLLGYTDWQDYVNQVTNIDLQSMDYVPHELYAELLEAIKADCEEGNLIQSEIFYYVYSEKDHVEIKDWITITMAGDKGMQRYQELQFYTRSKHIMAFLEKYDTTE